MMLSRQVIIKPGDGLFGWCDENAHKAKLLKNACMFRLRNIEFAWRKGFKGLNAHQLEVISEFNDHCGRGFLKDGQPRVPWPEVSVKNHTIGYCRLDHVMKVTDDPDYRSGLPMHAVQGILKQAVRDMKAYHSARRAYRKDPSKFTGEPRIPGYVRGEVSEFEVSSQECHAVGGRFLKMPKTKVLLDIGMLLPGKLVHVSIVPYYSCYKACVIYETEDPAIIESGSGRILGLDPGVKNFLTAGSNCGLKPFIVNGKGMRAMNARFNAEHARLSSAAMACQGVKVTEALRRLWKKRDCFLRDQFHKVSCFLVRYCREHGIGTIVYGMNAGWKKETKMRKKEKKDFIYLPHGRFFQVLEDHCLRAGISCIRSEESYTSQASFFDMDDIPVYGKKPAGWKPSGKRVKRGCYISFGGRMVNADVNGACNIIRKVFPHAFDGVTDFSYLLDTVERVAIV